MNYLVRRLKNKNYQYLTVDYKAVNLISEAWQTSKESAVLAARSTYGAWHAIGVSQAHCEASLKIIHETKLDSSGNKLCSFSQ